MTCLLRRDGAVEGECTIGGFFGAKFATVLSGVTLSRIFGAAMLVVSIKMILAK
jgi:uncharacterized membrane protein YfcA